MPPKPSQAGRFKPLKRPAKPVAKPAAATAAPPAAAPTDAGRGRSDGRGREGTGRDGRGRDGRGREGRGRDGRGGGRGRDGRGRDGRGRGRFVAPTGATFFTGDSTKAAVSKDASKPAAVTAIAAGQDGAVVLPFTKPFSLDGRSGSSGVARSAAESMAAAARARLGEGEEIVVAEMEKDDDDFEEKKKSVLEIDRPSRMDGMPSLFDDENVETSHPDGLDVDNIHVYDSDSSEEERRRVKQTNKGKGKDDKSGSGLEPHRLPFPLTYNQSSAMYACQENIEEKKDMEGIVSSSGAAVALNSDPEVSSPFLDWDSPKTREDAKFAERNSWFLMKFPTRLPHLDGGSLVGGGGSSKTLQSNESDGGLVKSEVNEDGVEVVGSSGDVADTVMAAGGDSAIGAGSGTAVGYDDTLKDIAPGRYGKIVVYKSGRTELVVGGHDGGAEVRMLIHEGLQCGFRQEAVSIDPEEGMFVPLGDVTKSLIVTPDVERAFVFS